MNRPSIEVVGTFGFVTLYSMFMGWRLSLLVLLLISGCSREPSVVGKWADPLAKAAGFCEFKEDGTYVWNLTFGSGSKTSERDDSGTYSFDGNTLTLDSSGGKVALRGREVDIPPKKAKISQRVDVTPDSIVFKASSTDEGAQWVRVN